MQTLQLTATKREAYGKKNTKALRREGMVPGVIYGGAEEVTFAISEKALKPLIYTPNAYIVEIDIEGKKEVGVMREVQFHPVKEQILHIDFYRVQEGKPVAIEIPVRLTGNSAGVKLGGKLMQSRRKLRVSGLVENLPDVLEVDITELGIGKSIFVSDLQYDNLTILTPATTAVCAVRTTRAVAAAQAAARNAKK